MKNNKVTEEMKEFIRRNGADLTVLEMAKVFETTETIMANTIQRYNLPFKRVTQRMRPVRPIEVRQPDPEPARRQSGVYDNIRSPYGIYSDTLNIQLR